MCKLKVNLTLTRRVVVGVSPENLDFRASSATASGFASRHTVGFKPEHLPLTTSLGGEKTWDRTRVKEDNDTFMRQR